MVMENERPVSVPPGRRAAKPLLGQAESVAWQPAAASAEGAQPTPTQAPTLNLRTLQAMLCQVVPLIGAMYPAFQRCFGCVEGIVAVFLERCGVLGDSRAFGLELCTLSMPIAFSRRALAFCVLGSHRLRCKVDRDL